MSSSIRAQAIYLVLLLLLCNVLALRKWPSTLVPLSGAESKCVADTLSNLEDAAAQGTGDGLIGMDDDLSPTSTQLKIGAVIKALDLVGAHAKDAGLIGLKLVAVLSVSRMLIKTVMRWYVDFTKDELLFDSRDHRYRNFGAIFHDAASTTILASSALRGKLHVDNGNESLILDHLMNCLNVDCFTHTMQDFSVIVQDEMAATIDVANAHRRVTGCGRPGAAAWTGSSSSSSRAPAFTSVYFAATALLVVRQADAQLRLARNHLMRSATRLEDYLEHLSSKVVYDNTGGHFDQLTSHIRFVSEPLRNAATILFPKVFGSQRRLGKLGKVKGIVAAIDSSHHRERITAVKEWIDSLYVKLKVVQDHLDELQIIEAKRSSKRLSALPSNVLPWSQRAFELCQESAEALRNGHSDREEVDETTTMTMTKTTKKWETSLTNKIAIRKASSRQLQKAIHEMNDAAKGSGKAVKAMPEYFRARLDIETRIGDVMSVRHRTRLGLMSTMRFCGQHFASAAKLTVTLLIMVGGVRLRQNSDLISQRIDLIRSNSKGFLERRVVGPAVSILNDVVLNKKVAITDHAALKDSQRSLATMLDDFLTQYKPQMPSEERAKRVARMDMTDVSLEYEQELKKPMQNIMSGRIARLALIQGQFVKKELLVAMQAIDDLVNANQVNLQLLAVMPAIMIGFVVSSGIKALLTTARSFNRGSSRLVQTKQMVRRDLRNGFRTLERQLLVNALEVSPGTAASNQDTATSRGRGRTMCILYRMHRTIMDKSELMGDDALVKQLLQDLSDLMTPNLLPERQIALLKLCQDNL